ncbi:hypothetical protein [Nostoc sp.]|uniref:hypothetical protein n=1 Tax=Nostoc sp. TaxID=1180 RepID=UPI002FFC9D1B
MHHHHKIIQAIAVSEMTARAITPSFEIIEAIAVSEIRAKAIAMTGYSMTQFLSTVLHKSVAF